ncbi:MAG: sulfatase-like hydrolase/transferase [Planctomycetota bacterium]
MTRSNIVLFTWHDAGDWFGCYGYDSVQTPHVDRLAAEGVRFTRHYSACAICSPSRAAIATGRHCQANGVMTLANGPFMNRIHPHITHLARRCKESGYRTALIGVQHEAAHQHVPAVLGVDEQIATDPWPDADRLCAQVEPWLARQTEQDAPFYLQIGTYDAHLNRFYSGQAPDPAEAYSPVQDDSRGLHLPDYLVGSDEDRATVATLQGHLQRGDRLMGAVLDGLDRHGLRENTIVAMCVDHGVGLTRAKTTCYEAGNRVGWIIRAPDRLPAGHVVDELCAHVDVLPTLWELLGEAPIPGLDGHSLAAHARGTAAGPVRLWDFLIEQDDFLVHQSVRCDWERRTRDDLEAHCRRHGLPIPMADGPLHNPVDGLHASV